MHTVAIPEEFYTCKKCLNGSFFVLFVPYCVLQFISSIGNTFSNNEHLFRQTGFLLKLNFFAMFGG